jgi:hypothetical protein
VSRGPLETFADCQDVLWLLAKEFAAEGDRSASMRAIGVLVGTFRAKELELKGINTDRPESEGGEIKLTLVDYLPRYQEAEKERKRFEEHVAALGAQLRWGLRIWLWASAAWIWVVVDVQLDLISKSIDPFSRAIRAARLRVPEWEIDWAHWCEGVVLFGPPLMALLVGRLVLCFVRRWVSRQGDEKFPIHLHHLDLS